METALPAAADAFTPVPLFYAEPKRKKTHDEALSQLGSRRRKCFMKGMKCGCKTAELVPGNLGTWELDTKCQSEQIVFCSIQFDQKLTVFLFLAENHDEFK